jgi:hypothetical protein
MFLLCFCTGMLYKQTGIFGKANNHFAVKYPGADCDKNEEAAFVRQPLH